MNVDFSTRFDRLYFDMTLNMPKILEAAVGRPMAKRLAPFSHDPFNSIQHSVFEYMREVIRR